MKRKEKKRSEGTVTANPNQEQVAFPHGLRYLNGRMYHRAVLEDIIRTCYVLCWGEKQYVLSLGPKSRLQSLHVLELG